MKSGMTRWLSKLVALQTLGTTAFTALLIAGAPRAASADVQQVPFTATYSGAVTPPHGPPPVTLNGTGTGTMLGNSTNAGRIAVTGQASSCPSTGFAVENDETLTAANGDQLTLTVHDESCPVSPDRPGVYHGVGVFVITGGTGRFSGATGNGSFSGTGDFSQGQFTFSFKGTISAPAAA